MKIAIIGVGNVGSALARRAVAAGHDVSLSAAHQEKVTAVAAETGARAAADNTDAVNGAELVVLAVPASAVQALVAELGDALAGSVLVDATNPLNATYSDLTTSGRSAAEELAAQAPQARVVKAFNTLLAARMADPAQDGTPLDAYYAGDDDSANSATAELLTSLGYRPIKAGGLRMARSLEEMAFLNISLNAGNGWPWQSAWKLVGPTG